jgi:hypothetical protein
MEAGKIESVQTFGRKVGFVTNEWKCKTQDDTILIFFFL